MNLKVRSSDDIRYSLSTITEVLKSHASSRAIVTTRSLSNT